MSHQSDLAENFKSLHQPGNPVILYNVWDPGSAQAVASVGAKAIATGGHGVANAFGYEDGEELPLEEVLANATRITRILDIPFTMDIDAGYGESLDEVKETIRGVIKAGVVGINIEDKRIGTKELRDTADQAARLKAIREAADEADVHLFINARTDVFSTVDPTSHNDDLVEVALARAQAYKQAGADGFFVPLLSDIDLIKKLCDASPLPVNILWLDGSPSPAELAAAGVARISYGPGPYLKMVEWLKQGASEALSSVR